MVKKRHFFSCIILGVVVASLSGCAGGHLVRLYSGAPLSPDEAARLVLSPNVYVYRVNGRDVDWTGTAYEFEPGTYMLTLTYFEGETRRYRGGGVLQVPFHAQAGHSYTLYYRVQYESSQEWQAWIVDTTPAVQ